MIKVSNLTKKFGSHISLDNVSVEFNKNDYLNFTNILNNIVYEAFELNKKEIEYINSHF